MNLLVELRRGRGPFWGTLKRLIKQAMGFHIPVMGPTRWLFGLLYLVHVGLRQVLETGLRFFWYEPLFRSQCERIGPGFRMELLPYVVGSGKIVLGSHVRFGGKQEFIFGNQTNALPEVVVGDHTFIGHLCSILAASSVRIGRHCLLAGGVRVCDYDGHPTDAGRRRAGEPTPADAIRPVVIGDDVWVGQDAKILKGVRVGDRSVIGAGAVVVKDVPADVVVAGNPARVVKRLAP
jgi:acetyltransferase-like isoleucine patch superfamily enzyme